MISFIKNYAKSLPLILLCQSYVNISFIFFILLVAFLGFIVHIPVSRYEILISFALTVIVSIYLSRYYFGQNKKIDLTLSVLWLVLLLIMLLICGEIATGFYDLSVDGQWYHQGDILLLVNGWNPLIEKVPTMVSGYFWMNHYPKAAEIASAGIMAFSGHIEDGKLLNLFLMITSFLVSFSTILLVYPQVRSGYATIISLIVALNPVSIYQSLSYYVDGQMASLFTILIFLLILSTKKIDQMLSLILSFVIIYMINVKTTGIVYIGIILIGYIIFNYLNHKLVRYHFYILVLPLLFGLLIGFNPYITNTLDNGNPFYPTLGSNIDIFTPNTPVTMLNKNQVENFFISQFYKSEDGIGQTQFKLPLTYSGSEIEAYQYPDVRVGGFGPFFGGIILISLIIIAIILYYHRDTIRLDNFVIYICALILLTVAINPQSWWARYVPQLWLIAPLILLHWHQLFSNSKKIICYLLTLIIILNIMLIVSVYYPYQYESAKIINDQLILSKNYSLNNTLYVDFNGYIANEERFKEYGISYVEAGNLTGYNITMYSSGTKIYF